MPVERNELNRGKEDGAEGPWPLGRALYVLLSLHIKGRSDLTMKTCAKPRDSTSPEYYPAITATTY